MFHHWSGGSIGSSYLVFKEVKSERREMWAGEQFSWAYRKARYIKVELCWFVRQWAAEFVRTGEWLHEILLILTTPFYQKIRIVNSVKTLVRIRVRLGCNLSQLFKLQVIQVHGSTNGLYCLWAKTVFTNFPE